MNEYGHSNIILKNNYLIETFTFALEKYFYGFVKNKISRYRYGWHLT